MPHLENTSPVDDSENTPLHYAARCGHLKLVIFFIQNSSDKIPRDCAGRTPLHFAAKYGHVEIVKELYSIKEKIPKDINGRTPIHLAASRGHLEVIKFFAPLAKSELFSKLSASALLKLIKIMHT